MNSSTHRQTFRVQTIIRDESCLLCSNIQMCTRASQVHKRFKLFIANSPGLRQYRQRSGIQFCPLCPGCYLLQLSSCKSLAARFPQPLDHEFLLLTRATEADKSSCFPNNSAAAGFRSALSQLRYHVRMCFVVKEMQQHVCVGTAMA